MSARCNRTPLTDAQRALAGDPRNVRHALAAVARWRRQWPWLAEDIDSAALEGLVKAARAFDPDRGLAFATLLRHAVVGRVADYLRDFVAPMGYRRRGYGTAPRFSRWPMGKREGSTEEVVWSDEGPVGWEADALEGLNELTKGLPPQHKRVVRAYYGRAGATLKQIAAEMGLGESRASQMHAQAIAMLREKFQTQEEACR